jgi:uncharacterized protein
MMAFGTSEDVDALLAMKTWAVVGLSKNQERAAFGVSRLLIDKGHQIFPVHPKAETVHEQPGFSSLAEIPTQIDVVDVFVNSDQAGAVVDQAIAIGAKGIWLQLGVVDEAAFARAKAAGVTMVMDRCPAIEYRQRA